MESISANSEVGGAGGAYSYNALKRLDQLWSHICSGDSGWSRYLVPVILTNDFSENNICDICRFIVPANNLKTFL